MTLQECKTTKAHQHALSPLVDKGVTTTESTKRGSIRIGALNNPCQMRTMGVQSHADNPEIFWDYQLPYLKLQCKKEQ